MTFKSLLQHHSSRASILHCSAFFMVQLSQLYVATGKTIALTIRTFIDSGLADLCQHRSNRWSRVDVYLINSLPLGNLQEKHLSTGEWISSVCPSDTCSNPLPLCLLPWRLSCTHFINRAPSSDFLLSLNNRSPGGRDGNEVMLSKPAESLSFGGSAPSGLFLPHLQV